MASSPASENAHLSASSAASAATPSERCARDRSLIAAALQGKRSAIDLLIERLGCIPRILAAKNARLGAPLTNDELADLTQDVLARLWTRLDQFRGEAQLETWVYPFCVLELMNASRRKRRAQKLRDSIPLRRPPREATEPELPQDFGPLYEGLDALPEAQAQIIRLRHFQQLSFESIAERLTMPHATVKTNYYRGVRRLRDVLLPYVRKEAL